jgi:hypothetical protein
MPREAVLSRVPWAPFLRLSCLTAGVFAAMRTGFWSDSLAFAVLLCLLPIVLHMALVLPKPQPLTKRHPYIIGWIYGISALGPVAWVLTWLLAPLMGGTFGMNVGFLLRDGFHGVSEAFRAGIALLCLGAALTIVMRSFLAIRDEGWKLAVVARPQKTIAALLVVPACSAFVIAGGCSLLRTPEIVLQASAFAVHTVFYSEVLAARSVTFLGFPVAICFSLWRGVR